MRGSKALAIATGLLSTCTSAIELHKRNDGPPRVVGFPIERRAVSNPVVRDNLRRRANTVQVTLDNEVNIVHRLMPLITC
jgi:hypothetical protein